VGSLKEKLEFIQRGGKTKRFHTADTLTTQTVGEHSFGVAWLVTLMLPSIRKELILAALAHDLAEHVVGDVSSPAKRKHPALKAALDVAEGSALSEVGLSYEPLLYHHEKLALKLADMLDGLLFCVRERQMGSAVATPIYYNFLSYIGTHLAGEDFNVDTKEVKIAAKDILEIILTLWEDANER